MENEKLNGLKSKYAGILVNYDNNISRGESDIRSKKLELESLEDKVRAMKEERERILGALGVLTEAEELEEAPKEEGVI